ncbi:hypothetical protein HC174_03890 [Salinimicrobium sp. CDJ15-81-2]|nr:hypothetical protein [Salinimicrobium nanhaiense]
MKYKIVIAMISLAVFVLGCGTSADLKKVYYTSDFLSSTKKGFETHSYVISVPRKYKLIKEDFNPEYKEIIYEYKDSIKFYITDDTFGGSSLNGDNKLRSGITSISRTDLNDTTKMGGVQQDGRYWKEYILGDVVVGYLNVPENRKEEFDLTLQSINRKD